MREWGGLRERLMGGGVDPEDWPHSFLQCLVSFISALTLRIFQSQSKACHTSSHACFTIREGQELPCFPDGKSEG